MSASGVVNKGNYFGSQFEAWSYSTCIRATTGDGIIVVNRTEYSKSTTQHQNLDAAFWRGKSPVLEITNAPYDATPDKLFELAVEKLTLERSKHD